MDEYPEYQPLNHIPRAWIDKARCPICSQPGLRILNQGDAPEQMKCGTCAASFEIEAGSAGAIRLCELPSQLQGYSSSLLNRWLSVEQVRNILAQTQPDPIPAHPEPSKIIIPPEKTSTPTRVEDHHDAQQPTSPAPSREPAGAAPEARPTLKPEGTETTQPAPSTDQVFQRARALYVLGASPSEILEGLLENGATRQQAADALRSLAQEQRKKRNRSMVYVLLAIALFLLLVAAAALLSGL